jgi:hypothetical protein
VRQGEVAEPVVITIVANDGCQLGRIAEGVLPLLVEQLVERLAAAGQVGGLGGRWDDCENDHSHEEETVLPLPGLHMPLSERLSI